MACSAMPHQSALAPRDFIAFPCTADFHSLRHFWCLVILHRYANYLTQSLISQRIVANMQSHRHVDLCPHVSLKLPRLTMNSSMNSSSLQLVLIILYKRLIVRVVLMLMWQKIWNLSWKISFARLPSFLQTLQIIGLKKGFASLASECFPARHVFQLS